MKPFLDYVEVAGGVCIKVWIWPWERKNDRVCPVSREPFSGTHGPSHWRGQEGLRSKATDVPLSGMMRRLSLPHLTTSKF